MKITRGIFSLIVLLGAAGCPGNDATAGRVPVRFSFWGNFKDFDMWRQMIADFEARNPDVDIRAEYITGDYHQKLPLQFISGTAADLVLMDDEQYPAYAVRGYLEDLEPYIERDRAELRIDGFFPTAMESFNYRGLQAGLPWDGTTMLIYYNKELFRKEGIPFPEPDWTWQDFREIARRLTRDLDGDGRPDQFGTNLPFDWIPVEPLVWSFGADILNEDRTAFALNSPEGLEAIQFQYDMKYKDHSIAWTGEIEGYLDEVALLTGRVGMVLAGAYIMITLESVKDAMEWDMVIPPAGPRGHRFTRVTWDGISINRHTTPEKKEAAWRFIKYLLSEDGQRLIGESGRAIPVHEGDAWKYWPRPHTEAREEIAIEAIRYGRLTPITPKYLELRAGMVEDWRSLMFGTATPIEALARMEPKVNAILRDGVRKWGRPERR